MARKRKGANRKTPFATGNKKLPFGGKKAPPFGKGGKKGGKSVPAGFKTGVKTARAYK